VGKPPMSMFATMADVYRFVKQPDKHGLNHYPDPRISTEPSFRVHQPTARGPLKRDRTDILHLQSLPNPEPSLACSTRTPFLGEAIESHPNRLDAEVALKIGFRVVSDCSGLRTFRPRLLQAFEHNVAKAALLRGSSLHPLVERSHKILQHNKVVVGSIKTRLG
jgi:hypothetical protein